MKFCLIVAAVAATVGVSSAAPGMRGNGASGATRDVDPANPNVGSGSNSGPRTGAIAMASGEHPAASSYSEKRDGELSSIAKASNSEGSSAAQASPHGSSSSAVNFSRGGSAVASASSSKGNSQAMAESSGGSPASGSSLVAVRG